VVLIFAFTDISAQTILRGCLDGTTTGGIVYTDAFLGYYQRAGNQYRTVPPNCPRVQLGMRDGNCYFDLLGTAYPQYRYTLITTSSSPVACNLDHYVFGILFALGLFGMRRITMFPKFIRVSVAPNG